MQPSLTFYKGGAMSQSANTADADADEDVDVVLESICFSPWLMNNAKSM